MAQRTARKHATAIAAGEACKKSARLRFYGDEFVFDTVSGLFYRVSPSAAFMLRAMARGAAPGELADALCARYGIDRAVAMRDAELFLNDVASLAREEIAIVGRPRRRAPELVADQWRGLPAHLSKPS